jgi:hypothetical protein
MWRSIAPGRSSGKTSVAEHYTGFFREEIGRTISDSGDVDAELHELCEALIAAEGRIMP